MVTSPIAPPAIEETILPIQNDFSSTWSSHHFECFLIPSGWKRFGLGYSSPGPGECLGFRALVPSLCSLKSSCWSFSTCWQGKGQAVPDKDAPCLRSLKIWRAGIFQTGSYGEGWRCHPCKENWASSRCCSLSTPFLPVLPPYLFLFLITFFSSFLLCCHPSFLVISVRRCHRSVYWTHSALAGGLLHTSVHTPTGRESEDQPL